MRYIKLLKIFNGAMSKGSRMAKKKKVRKVSDSANNIHLKWKYAKDRAAVEAIREVAEKLECDTKSATRWICINCKTYALKKAEKVKKLLAS